VSEDFHQTRTGAEKWLLAAGADQLRHLAFRGTYAGMHGQYVGLSFASALEALVQGRDPRSSLLRAAERLVYGPDGPNDPRGRKKTGLGGV